MEETGQMEEADKMEEAGDMAAMAMCHAVKPNMNENELPATFLIWMNKKNTY
jgi:hypothetical protein